MKMRASPIVWLAVLATATAWTVAPLGHHGVTARPHVLMSGDPTARIAALKAEGEASVARRSSITAANLDWLGSFRWSAAAEEEGEEYSIPPAAEDRAVAINRSGSKETRIASLKAEGKVAVARRCKIAATTLNLVPRLVVAGDPFTLEEEVEFSFPPVAAPAPSDPARIATLKAEGEATVARRKAKMDKPGEETRDSAPSQVPRAPRSPVPLVPPPTADRIATLKAEGEATVARRATIDNANQVVLLGAAPSPLAPRPARPAAPAATPTPTAASTEEEVPVVAASPPSAPPPPPPAPPPPPPPPPAAPSPAGTTTLVAQSRLPAALQEALTSADLLDPTTFEKEDQTNSLGAVAAGSLAVFLLPLFEAGLLGDVVFSTLVGGGLVGYAALRKDSVGSLTRDVGGRGVVRAAQKVQELEKEYEVTTKAKETANKVANQLTDQLKKRF